MLKVSLWSKVPMGSKEIGFAIALSSWIAHCLSCTGALTLTNLWQAANFFIQKDFRKDNLVNLTILLEAQFFDVCKMPLTSTALGKSWGYYCQQLGTTALVEVRKTLILLGIIIKKHH